MSTITEISASDKISDSRDVINTNFSNLNTDKVEPSSTETLTNKTLTTPVINGAVTGTITPPLTFYGTNFVPPRGFLINGKIVPSVASDNLTVAIKGLDGNDPSATNPVYCRIGDTIRSITAALSVTKDAGTNWCNAGAAELATQEIDYFVYLGYNATDGVVIGFSRIPGASEYDDFSSTTTNEKYCAISTIANAAAGDDYELIGRFAATLSAGAGYTWSVPTFTNKNLIQRPIYETRWLDWVPAGTGSGSMTISSLSILSARYKIKNRSLLINLSTDFTTGGTASNTVNHTMPISAINQACAIGGFIGDPVVVGGMHYIQAASLYSKKIDNSNWTLGASENVYAGGEVELA